MGPLSCHCATSSGMMEDREQDEGGGSGMMEDREQDEGGGSGMMEDRQQDEGGGSGMMEDREQDEGGQEGGRIRRPGRRRSNTCFDCRLLSAVRI